MPTGRSGEPRREEKLFEAVTRMRELAAHCVLYLRENPEDTDGIEQILEDREGDETA